MADSMQVPTPKQAEVWDWLESHPDSTGQEIATGTRMTDSAAYTHLSHLTSMGYVSHTPRKKGTRQYRSVHFWEDTSSVR